MEDSQADVAAAPASNGCDRDGASSSKSRSARRADIAAASPLRRSDLASGRCQPPRCVEASKPAGRGDVPQTRLEDWRCVGGVERWTVTKGVKEVATERSQSLAEIIHRFGREEATGMVRGWEMSEDVVVSCVGNEKQRWMALLGKARAEDKAVAESGSTRGLPSACRLLLLFETAVESDEMGTNRTKWDKERTGWCKSVSKLGVGELFDLPHPYPEHTHGYALYGLALEFASKIDAKRAFTEAFANGSFAEWKATLKGMRDQAGATARSSDEPRAKRQRGTQKKQETTYDASAFIHQLHVLCDHMKRWQDVTA